MLMRPLEPELKNPLDVLNLARLHSKLHEIENITWFEGMKAYAEQVENGLIPYNTKVFINSIGGVVLSDDELNEFNEKYYDYLKNMVIEITESEQDDDESIRKKRWLAERWKALIAIDDYGSGYNGEVSLLYFQPNIIKIDINIIQGVDHDTDRLNLLKNIIQYAKQKNIRILAEGVNTSEELKTVIECGVDLVQGFYLATPVFIPRDISAKLRREIGEYKYGS
jgi:EAL domain-containing protein (putative c-di-GMP-specific phosphodiesterase class I)